MAEQESLDSVIKRLDTLAIAMRSGFDASYDYRDLSITILKRLDKRLDQHEEKHVAEAKSRERWENWDIIKTAVSAGLFGVIFLIILL